jgi:hypothetical protein
VESVLSASPVDFRLLDVEGDGRTAALGDAAVVLGSAEEPLVVLGVATVA